MSDALPESGYPMSGADTAIAVDAAKRVGAAIAAMWECVDGPASALFHSRSKQGADQSIIYTTWNFVPIYDLGRDHSLFRQFGSKSIEMLVEWFPDGVLQEAESLTRYAAMASTKKPPKCDPETHRIVWRHRPEFHKRDDGRWYLYARFGFMPKDAWFLDRSEGEL